MNRELIEKVSSFLDEYERFQEQEEKESDEVDFEFDREFDDDPYAWLEDAIKLLHEVYHEEKGKVE